MKCPECNTKNPADVSICSNCGAQLLENIRMQTLDPPNDDLLSFRTKTIQTPVDELLGKSTFAGKYIIEREIGRGGMGVVYKARDIKLNRIVALKFLPKESIQDPEAKERFIREAQAAAALDHPNICTVYEVDEAEGKTFISMAYVEGQSLKKIIKENPPELSAAFDIAIQVAEGLDKAHKKGIVHRDIKSANIMLNEENRAQIMDFGLAKISGAQGFTKTGTTMGTIGYMSPEQAKGKATDFRTDIFSFGAVFYELITGQLPFKGESEALVLHSLLYDEPEPLKTHIEDIPEEWQWVIEKALSKDIDTRYQNTAELLSDLKILGAGLEGEADYPPIKRIKKSKLTAFKTATLKSWKRASWAQRLGVGLVLALLIAAAVIFWPFSGGVVPTAEAASLVALPAQVYGDAVDNYLAEAIPGTLSTMLSGIKWLATKVPPSSFEVEKVQGDLVKIGEAYNVKMCVISSVTIEMKNLILNVQLVEPLTKNVLWGKVYKGTRNNYIDLVREAARGILQAIQPEVSLIVSEVGLAKNSEAELVFRRGQYHSNRYNNLGQPEDFDNAFAAFKQVLQLDPDMADPAAEIAMLFKFKTEKGSPPQETIPEIDSWAHQALKINENCSKAWIALALNETLQPIPSWRKLLEYGIKASNFGKEDSMAHLALSYGFLYSGSFSLALEACLEARLLDPLYLPGSINASENLFMLGRNQEALAIADEILRIEPDIPWGLFNKSLILSNLNRLHEAADLLKRLEKLVAENKYPQEYLSLAQLVYNLNSEEEGVAKMALDSLLQIVNDPTIPNLTLRYLAGNVSQYLMATEKLDPMFHLLNKAMEAGIAIPYDIFLLNPKSQLFLRDPRFEEIIKSSKDQFKKILDILEDARSRGELPEYLEKPLADLFEKFGINGE
ncbi:MAG: protein kinase [Candidatus Aminicenantes bacterium]|nr:protein kinase [Candidatus Aminicenantes bacterium]